MVHTLLSFVLSIPVNTAFAPAKGTQNADATMHSPFALSFALPDKGVLLDDHAWALQIVDEVGESQRRHLAPGPQASRLAERLPDKSSATTRGSLVFNLARAHLLSRALQLFLFHDPRRRRA